MFRGAETRRRGEYELALYTAWHMAAFNSAAKVGKLKDFSEYRNQLLGAAGRAHGPKPKQTWQEQKAMMAQFAAHTNKRSDRKAQRKAKPRG